MKRNFHPGWVKRQNGCHHLPFSRELWNRWLEQLNEKPSEKLAQGIREFRDMLDRRAKL